ncbi:MAG TPA: DUF58 domain-containing protein [Candidatus Limnocylindrales bacterium]|nr:DUF58 domain-containing protein [Candidatus Limnocylindrales bacterium]
MNRELLPSAVDPTVFDEAFLRQLERLMLVTKTAVHGGMKGVRRSVKRGQSVEFTDYRDYSLGDDLRALDWNLYARLERLFIKLFIEEEDVNVHILLDASASMDGGAPDKLLFGKRAAAALAYVGLASYDRVSMAVLQGRVARRFPSVRGTGRIFQVLADLSSVKPHPGPTDLAAATRHYAAQLTQRGPLMLISDLFDPNAERAISELASTRCEVAVLHTLSPDELDPPIEGDLRLVDRETGDAVNVTADLYTLDAYKARLAEWQARLDEASAKRRVAYVPTPTSLPLSDLVFAELRRRHVVAA